MTVTVQGLTGGPLAWLLKLRCERKGFVFLGGNALARTFASLLGDRNQEVLLLDSSPDCIRAAEKAGLQPMARLVSYAFAGVDPAFMGEGPIPAVTTALQRAGLTAADLDVIESNEAFAAQALAVCKGLELDPAKTNPNGGAVALGHPIGATGARILITLIYALRHRGLKKGIASLCLGGGDAIAMAVEIV